MLTNKTRIRDGRGRPRKKTVRARKVPTQVRSQETVSVILEASARILESDGLHGFNTNAIAARAGVSIGSLYQYFPNKDAILLALIGRFEEALHDAVLNTMQGGRGQELKPRLRLLVRALVMAHYDRPRLNRVLEAEEERLGSGAESAAFHASVLHTITRTRKRSGRACLGSNGAGHHCDSPRFSGSGPRVRRKSPIGGTASHACRVRIPALWRPETDDYRLGLSSFKSCCERLAKREAHPYSDTMIPEAVIRPG
jgi:AcrR family transcriptional regulator